MTDQCYVHYSGCMEWDAFEKADVVFGLIRNGRTTVKRKADLCDEKQQSNIFPVVHGFPFPEMCGSPKVVLGYSECLCNVFRLCSF